MKKMLLILLLVLLPFLAFAQDFSKGPLYGKNMYVPFIIHYHLPALAARSGEQFDFQFRQSFYLAQDVLYFFGDLEEDDLPTERIYNTDYVFSDYEVFTAETSFAFNILDKLQLGADLRIISYYGGFMDSFIESFHGLFGFPNGAREYFFQNQLYINFPNNNGINMYLDKNAVSFGDIDLWGKWTFFENSNFSIAALAAFKIPTGSLDQLSGTGFPDAGLGLLLDFRVARYLSLYTQAGAVMPFNGKSNFMFNGMLGAEVHPTHFFSFNVQMNIKTSPLNDDTIIHGLSDLFNTTIYHLNMPQFNILGGFVLKFDSTRLQFYFEQDAFTNMGADITFGIMLTYIVNLRD